MNDGIMCTKVVFEVLGMEHFVYAPGDADVGTITTIKAMARERIFETAHVNSVFKQRVTLQEYDTHHYLKWNPKKLEK